jgi:molybdopterin molybdotransferase
MARADIVITTGGASVGAHDLVRPALAEAGATLDFWRIAMRPGKPLLAGRLGDAVVLGLPGNPVSAFVTARLFLLPLIARLGGAAAPVPATEPAALAAALPPVGNRDDYVRATLANGGVTPLPDQSSGALSTLALTEALIVRPAGAAAAAAGEIVNILRVA